VSYYRSFPNAHTYHTSVAHLLGPRKEKKKKKGKDETKKRKKKGEDIALHP